MDRFQEPESGKSSLMWVANIPSTSPKSVSPYRLAIVQEVLLEAKFSFQVLNDSILCALNLLIRSYSSGSIDFLWKSPVGQKHKTIWSVVRHSSSTKRVQCINVSYSFLMLHLFQLIMEGTMKAACSVQVTLLEPAFGKSGNALGSVSQVVRYMPRIGQACVSVPGRQQCKVKRQRFVITGLKSGSALY